MRTLLIFLLAFNGYAQTYYVSPLGNDSAGDGTIGNRFATPGYAALVARTNAIKSIKLASGNYYNTLINLTNAADSDLTIEAEPGAIPILYGGQPITGWTTNGSFQEATLPVFPVYTNNIMEFAYDGDTLTNRYFTNHIVSAWLIRDVLVDNVRIPQARLPAYGSAYGSWLYYVPSNNNYSVMKYVGTDIPDATVISNAELQVRWTWQCSKISITNIDTTAKTIMVSPPAIRFFGSIGWSNYALFNTAEGMTNGVWYHDRVNNKLIIRTNSLVGKTVIAPTRSSVAYLIGVTNVTLRGLTIRSTTLPFIVDGIGGRDLAGAIDGWDCFNIKVESCTIENVCASGIRLGVAEVNGSHLVSLNTTISSNVVNNTGGAAIVFINGTVNNNNITNVGEIFLAAAGIEQNGANAYMISNVVNRSAWTGISTSLGNSNVIVFNTVYDPILMMDDAAAIYSGSCSNVFIGFNQMFVQNDDNRRPASNAGMAFDGGANYSSMISNLVVGFHYPMGFNGTTGSLASNNICVASSNITAAISSGTSGGVYTHNVFDYDTYTPRDLPGTNSYANNYFYSPLGAANLPRNGIFTGKMIDSQYRLVHTSQIISPRIQPLVGLVPGNYSTISTVRTGSIRQP